MRMDVVVVLGPVVAHIQGHLPVLLRFESLDADPVGESQRRPNGTVLDGTTPHECCGTTQEYQPGLGLTLAVQKPRGGASAITGWQGPRSVSQITPGELIGPH